MNSIPSYFRGSSIDDLVQLTPSELQNKLRTNINYNIFENIALNRYGWDGLPDSIPERILEKYLYYYGKVGVFDDPEFGWLSLPLNPQGGMNVYFEYTRYNAFGNGYNKLINIDDNSVLVRNNYTMTPSFPLVVYYTDLITNIDRTIETQLYTLKKPYVFTGDEKSLMTIKNTFKQIAVNEPFITVTDKTRNKIRESLELIELNTDYHINDLFLVKNQIVADLCTKLGFRGQTYEKNERLLVDEINANNELVYMSTISEFSERQKAAKKMSEIMGRDIRVYYKVEDNFFKSVQEVVSGAGEVYDNTERSD